MPRVGSLSTSTRGRCVSHLASATFCWLPPDSVPQPAVDARRADAQALDVLLRRCARSAAGRSQSRTMRSRMLIVMFL